MLPYREVFPFAQVDKAPPKFSLFANCSIALTPWFGILKVSLVLSAYVSPDYLRTCLLDFSVCRPEQALAHILLIHQNYPGQFRHLAHPYLLPFTLYPLRVSRRVSANKGPKGICCSWVAGGFLLFTHQRPLVLKSVIPSTSALLGAFFLSTYNR